jgi:hypothetical protein
MWGLKAHYFSDKSTWKDHVLAGSGRNVPTERFDVVPDKGCCVETVAEGASCILYSLVML